MIALYTEASRASSAWAEPLETAYQLQHRSASQQPGARRTDITQPMRLLIGSVVQLGKGRPWGTITWLADVLGTSRQSIYEIGWAAGGNAAIRPGTAPSVQPVSNHGVVRQALTLLVVGCMRLRATQYCLASLLGHDRALGWLSGKVDEAGTRAGIVLSQTDWSGCRPLFVARDELYFDDMAFYLTVDARSLSIVSQHVEASADAATWGVSLALDQQRTSGRIMGISEDAAPYFAASIAEARDLLEDPWAPLVQKDVWHLQDHAGEVVAAADRSALAKLAAAEKIATQVLPGYWRLANVRRDGKAEHAAAARAIDEADAIRDAVALLAPALAVVDTRTDAIMDRPTAGWTLLRIAEHLTQHGGERGADLAATLDRQAPQLLTFHGPLATAMESWRRQADGHFGDPALADLLERQVARVWRLTQEQLSGRRTNRDHALVAATARLRAYCQNDPVAERLADDLREILEAVVRTSSSVECVNSLLRAYLTGRRHFSCRRTARNWLNLLVLWHNMRPFQRGKRAGSSPFDLAGVVVRGPDGQPTKDWLTALGYPQAA